MTRAVNLLIALFILTIASCTIPTKNTVQPTGTNTSPPPVIAIETATATPPPSSTATIPPTQEPTTVPPTPTPEPTAQQAVLIEGDCGALQRPVAYAFIDPIHEFTSLADNARCTVVFPAGQQFSFDKAITNEGIYGSLFADAQLRLIRLNFDGTITELQAQIGGFYSGAILVSAETGQIVWADGDSDPDNPDLFIAKLWIANSDGSEQRVIYEHTTNLVEALILEIFKPIGFLPSGEVLFSIDPAGRGGGWIDTGEHTNLYQTATDSAEKRPEDRIFVCPDNIPFCVGAFTHDFSHFASTDREAQTMYIVQVDTRSEVWRTTITDRTFIGRPQFNANGDLAFVAVDVVENNNALYPENGYIGVVDFPYEGEVGQIPVELVTDLITWIDNDQLLYYELSSNSSGNWGYPIINRNGEELGTWQSAGRFPIIIR